MKKYLIWIGILLMGVGCAPPKEGTGEPPGPESAGVDMLGTQDYIWRDEARTDDDYGGQRLVNARIWYPARMGANELPAPTPYYYRINDAALHLQNWMSEDIVAVEAVPTGSAVGASIRETSEAFPLLIFSPSLGGNLSMYTYYAEHLAGQGFVVMGINHLYESEYVLDAEGTTFPGNQAFHDSLKALDIPADISAEAYRAAKGPRHKVLGEDLVFSLDQLAQEPFFKGKVQTDRVGVYGHSIGGAAAVYASLLDPRFAVVVDLDGTPPSVALESGIAAPFLFIEDLTDYPNHKGYGKMHARRDAFCELNAGDSWRILLGGIEHNSFLDVHYYLAEGAEEKNAARRVLDLTAGWMNDFFAHHLLSEPLEWTPQRSDSLEINHFQK